MARALNKADKEVQAKIRELQLFVNEHLKAGNLSNAKMGQLLINDIQAINHIWTKDKGTI
jgi:hypothetical protein